MTGRQESAKNVGAMAGFEKAANGEAALAVHAVPSAETRCGAKGQMD